MIAAQGSPVSKRKRATRSPPPTGARTSSTQTMAPVTQAVSAVAPVQTPSRPPTSAVWFGPMFMVSPFRSMPRELGLIEQTLRNWVKAAAAGKLNGPGTKVVTPEQMELSRVRAENIRLKRENEILKKATAYFARDVL